MPISPPNYDEALDVVIRAVKPLSSEQVSLRSALGRVLRSDIVADRDQPPFDRSAMDGFAVQSVDLVAGQVFSVVGSVAAGESPLGVTGQQPPPFSAIRIATGAAVPKGFDAVIPIEQSSIDQAENGDQVTFTIDAVNPWANIHQRGSDAKAGDVVVHSNQHLGPHQLGITATVGVSEPKVSILPKVTILTTGDEVLPPDTSRDNLAAHLIRNSNGPMLEAFLDSLGIATQQRAHVADEPDCLQAAMTSAIASSHLVVTVGAVSVGQRDWVPHVLEKLGMRVLLHGVAIQPGKPVLFAAGKKTLVVSLPGNPVSVLATSHLFLWPVIRRMIGLDPGLPWRMVELAEPVSTKASRQVFRVSTVNSGGVADVVNWHGSGDLVHTSHADGFVRLPLLEGKASAGTKVPFLPFMGNKR